MISRLKDLLMVADKLRSQIVLISYIISDKCTFKYKVPNETSLKVMKNIEIKHMLSCTKI